MLVERLSMRLNPFSQAGHREDPHPCTPCTTLSIGAQQSPAQSRVCQGPRNIPAARITEDQRGCVCGRGREGLGEYRGCLCAVRAGGLPAGSWRQSSHAVYRGQQQPRERLRGCSGWGRVPAGLRLFLASDQGLPCVICQSRVHVGSSSSQSH